MSQIVETVEKVIFQKQFLKNGTKPLKIVQFKVLAKSPERPNLIARLPGQGSAAPLLLYGHVDVVTTENQQWQHPPFAGKLVDKFVWGRGALDMKGRRGDDVGRSLTG